MAQFEAWDKMQCFSDAFTSDGKTLQDTDTRTAFEGLAKYVQTIFDKINSKVLKLWCKLSASTLTMGIKNNDISVSYRYVCKCNTSKIQKVSYNIHLKQVLHVSCRYLLTDFVGEKWKNIWENSHKGSKETRLNPNNVSLHHMEKLCKCSSFKMNCA